MTLLSLSAQAGGSAFCHTFGQKQAEERILAIMKFKKMSLYSFILAIVLVCGVTVAFATEPVSTPTAEGVPPEVVHEFACTHGHDMVLEAAKLLYAESSPEELQLENQAQSPCLHLNYDYIVQCTYGTQNDTEHLKIRTVDKFCYDCKKPIPVPSMTTSGPEPHSFGAGRYIGANHSGQAPSTHYFIYEHTCQDCLTTYPYTTLSHCTERGCVELNSVGDAQE